jgi:Ribbon-helix-helix protein, copG family
MTTKTSQPRMGRDPAAIEAALDALADEVAADDYELPADAQVRTPTPEESRAFLEEFISPDELDRISRGGRPSMSGAGTSPKRQVRLPADVDAALVRLAQAQGRTPSAVLRDAVTTYLRSA